MMTRDDVLRELELLPMWQLRAPKLMQTIVAEAPVAEVVTKNPAEVTQKADTKFDCYLSENNAWAFICTQDGMPADRMDTASQSMLFDNILIALQIKAKKYEGDLAAMQAKVFIAMGEKTAQTLLNSAEPIDSLRGKQHVLHNLPLIVTYSTAEILEHLPNKAKTWDDLCMALSIVNT
jgi:uracil-DNA glycosylase